MKKMLILGGGVTKGWYTRRRQNPGPGLPVYAVDLPGGGGKIRLHDDGIAGEKATPAGAVYILKDRNGSERYYPVN